MKSRQLKDQIVCVENRVFQQPLDINVKSVVVFVSMTVCEVAHKHAEEARQFRVQQPKWASEVG